MEFTITSVLSLFTLLALASGVFYAARRFRLPYTVLLVAVGIALVPWSTCPCSDRCSGSSTTSS